MFICLRMKGDPTQNMYFIYNAKVLSFESIMKIPQ